MPEQDPRQDPVEAGDHVVLIDGSAYIFRAYHALPPLTRPSDKLPVGAVAGFCNMLWKLVRAQGFSPAPTHLAVVFDKSEQTFRKDIYPLYKAQRPDLPEDLIPQFPLIREATRAFDLACVEQDKYEADDLMATYAELAKAKGALVTIISSDKDLMQLVEGSRVRMYDPMKDRAIGVEEVFEKFGVGPEKVVDVQSLAGDSVDNVPGVPGIGIKTAAQLLAEYGDLDTLLARAEEIKQTKRRENLIEFADQARLSRELVTLKRDVPLEVPLDDIAVVEPEGKKLIAFLKAMEFNTLTRRVAEAYEIEAAAIEPDSGLKAGGHESDELRAGLDPDTDRSAIPEGIEPPAAGESGLTPQALSAARIKEATATPVDRSKYETVTTLERLKEWVFRAFDLGIVAVDTETTGLDPMQADIVGFSLATAPNEACYVPLSHKGGDEGLFSEGLLPDQIPIPDAVAAIKPLMEHPGVLKIGQNLKYDWLILKRLGIELGPYDDTMLVSYVLDAGASPHGMDPLSMRWLGHTPIKFEEVCGKGKGQICFDRAAIDKATDYAAEDADVTLRLWRVLKPRLAAEGKTTVYETLERPLVTVLAQMEARGITIDRQMLSRLSGEFAQGMGRLEAEISEMAGETFNPGSPKQLGDILFGKMQIPGGRKTPTGAWSTGADVLEELAEQGHELPRRILDWRQLQKLKSTYTDALPTYVNKETGRVHTSFALAATTTGRLSSSEPNLQNIPVRTEEGRKIRKSLHRRSRPQAGLGRLFADRAAPARRDRRHAVIAPGLPGRARHPCDDGVGDVRRAGGGHAGRGAPAGEGDQFRHHLRHLGLRAGQPALHPPRGGRRLHQALFRALPRHPRLYGRDAQLRPRARLCGDAVRPALPLPRYQREEPVHPRLQRARGDQCPPAGLGRRHHPPRHGAHGRRAGEGGPIRPHAPAGA